MVDPEIAGRRDWSPQKCRAAAVNKVRNSVSVDGEGNRLAKFRLLKPGLFADDVRLRRQNTIQVEKKKVVFEAWTYVINAKGASTAMLLQQRIILSAEAIDNIRIAGLKANDFRVCIGHEEKSNLIQIGQPVFLAVDLPVKRIPFERQMLAGDILLEPKWAKPSHLLWRC